MCDSESLFADGVCVERVLPLAWHVAQPAEIRHCLRRATIVLQLLTLHAEGSGVRERSEPVHGDGRRLEQKLDLIIAMLGLLLEGDAQPPAEVAIRLGPRGLSWQSVQGPSPGETVIVDLYAEPGMPALSLPGTALPAEADRQVVRFDALPASLMETLEKWIFRLHRQSVARARAGRHT